MNGFSQKTLEFLADKYYVYALQDSGNQEIFYIGKGTGDRVFSHQIDAHKNLKSETEKLNRIHDIENRGDKVERIILHHSLSENEALACEAALINCLRYIHSGWLANIQGGYHATEVMRVEEFEQIYGAEELPVRDILENVIVIKINRRYKKGMSLEEIKEIVRGHWRIDGRKAGKAKYIFAVYNGLIVGVYEPERWYPSTEITPEFPRPEEIGKQELANRKYCVCKTVAQDSEIGKKYLGKTVSEFSKLTQNPISYIGNFS